MIDIDIDIMQRGNISFAKLILSPNFAYRKTMRQTGSTKETVVGRPGKVERVWMKVIKVSKEFCQVDVQ